MTQQGVKCCGEPRTTPFCPECGKKLPVPHPLWALVKYLRRCAKAQKTAAERGRRHAADDDPRGRNARRVSAASAAAAKWGCWADLLENLLVNVPHNPADAGGNDQ